MSHENIPARLFSALAAAPRLDVLLVAAVELGKESDEARDRALERAVLDAAIVMARRCLALIVLVIEQRTPLNPRVSTDVLPTEERLFADVLEREARALKGHRMTALIEAMRRRVG
jgi:hypothetical protein